MVKSTREEELEAEAKKELERQDVTIPTIEEEPEIGEFHLPTSSLWDAISILYQENDYARMVSLLFEVRAQSGSEVLSFDLKSFQQYLEQVLQKFNHDDLSFFLNEAKKSCEKWGTKNILIGILLFDISSVGISRSELKEKWLNCVARLNCIIDTNNNKLKDPSPKTKEEIILVIPNQEIGEVGKNDEEEIVELIGKDLGIIDGSLEVNDRDKFPKFVQVHFKSNFSIGRDGDEVVFTVKWINNIQENYASIRRNIPLNFVPHVSQLVDTIGQRINVYQIEWNVARTY